MGLGSILLCSTMVAWFADPPPPRPVIPLEADADRLPPLDRHADGSYTHRDRASGFEATIRPDGTVHFHDLVPLEVMRPRSIAWLIGLADALQRPPGERDRPDLEQRIPPENDASARAAAAMETIPHGAYGPPPIMGTLGVRIPGLAQLVVPSIAARAEFLRKTEPLRRGLAARARTKHLKRALHSLTTEVIQLLDDPTLAQAERKRRVFDLWDEAVEGSADPTALQSPTDLQQEAYGRAARRRIEALVRTHVPQGSAGAYTADELQNLNAHRKSRARFDPYTPTYDPADLDPNPAHPSANDHPGRETLTSGSSDLD